MAKTLYLTSLEKINSDIKSSTSNILKLPGVGNSKINLYDFSDSNALTYYNNSDYSIKIGENNKFAFHTGSFEINQLNTAGFSRISLGTNSQFKKIVANEITASIEQNNNQQNMFLSSDEISADIDSSNKFFKFSKINKTSPTPTNQNTGYINISRFNSISTYNLQDYQENIYFDLDESTQSTALSQPLNNEVIIGLPSQMVPGKELTITFLFGIENSLFTTTNNNGVITGNIFDIKITRQGSNDIQIIDLNNLVKQGFTDGQFNNQIVFKGERINNTSKFVLKILYVGENFLNVRFGNSSYNITDSTKDTSGSTDSDKVQASWTSLVSQPYPQWLVM